MGTHSWAGSPRRPSRSCDNPSVFNRRKPARDLPRVGVSGPWPLPGPFPTNAQARSCQQQAHSLQRKVTFTFVKVSHNDPSQCVRGAGTGGGV
jgi:hypothetical protein